MRSSGKGLVIAALLMIAAATATAQRSNVAQLFADAKQHEAAIRKELDARGSTARTAPLLARARTLVATYEEIARLFPASGYSDNALWQGGMLSADTFWQFGEAADR